MGRLVRIPGASACSGQIGRSQLGPIDFGRSTTDASVSHTRSRCPGSRRPRTPPGSASRGARLRRSCSSGTSCLDPRAKKRWAATARGRGPPAGSISGTVRLRPGSIPCRRGGGPQYHPDAEAREHPEHPGDPIVHALRLHRSVENRSAIDDEAAPLRDPLPPAVQRGEHAPVVGSAKPGPPGRSPSSVKPSRSAQRPKP